MIVPTNGPLDLVSTRKTAATNITPRYINLERRPPFLVMVAAAKKSIAQFIAVFSG